MFSSSFWVCSQPNSFLHLWLKAKVVCLHLGQIRTVPHPCKLMFFQTFSWFPGFQNSSCLLLVARISVWWGDLFSPTMHSMGWNQEYSITFLLFGKECALFSASQCSPAKIFLSCGYCCCTWVLSSLLVRWQPSHLSSQLLCHVLNELNYWLYDDSALNMQK